MVSCYDLQISWKERVPKPSARILLEHLRCPVSQEGYVTRRGVPHNCPIYAEVGVNRDVPEADHIVPFDIFVGRPKASGKPGSRLTDDDQFLQHGALLEFVLYELLDVRARQKAANSVCGLDDVREILRVTPA